MSLSAGRSTGSPLNNLHWNNVGLILAQRLLSWPNIKPTSFNVQCLPEADLIILEGGGRITNSNLLCRKLGWIHRTGRSNLHFAIWSTQLWWRPPRVSTVTLHPQSSKLTFYRGIPPPPPHPWTGPADRIPSHTIRRTNAYLLLVQRRRRWTNIESALVQGIVFDLLLRTVRALNHIVTLDTFT